MVESPSAASRQPSASDLHKGMGDVRRIAGTTVLVCHDADLGAILGQPQHGAHEVLAVGRINPGRPKHEVVGRSAGDPPFALQLGAPVGGDRSGGVGFEVGCALGPVEDVIGRQVQDRRTQFPRDRRQDAGTFGVEAKRGVRFALGLVDGRVGRSRYDGVGVDGPQRRGDRLGPGEIEIGACKAHDL